MGENQYDPAVHDTPLFCSTDACGVKNAPAGSAAYDPYCWRCGESLEQQVAEEGAVVTVYVVDEKADGATVTKTESGLIVFVHDEVAQTEFTVEITDKDRNCAYGVPVKDETTQQTTEQSNGGASTAQRLGSRENFWTGE